MCDGDKACGPCEAKKCEPVLQAKPPLIVWGPISDEVPSRDKPPKLIRLTAIREAFPQLLARGVVDINHKSEFTVGKLHALAQVDADLAPEAQRVMVREVVQAYGGLPTGMVKVTPAIAACFPRIAARIGEDLPFAATEILGDNRTSLAAQDDVLEGRLDSYSIAGTLAGTRYANHCDPTGCQVVQEAPSIDLNALTLTSYEGAQSMAAAGNYTRAANPSAAFVVVQQTLPQVESLKQGEASVGVVPEASATAPASDAPAVVVAIPVVDSTASASTSPPVTVTVVTPVGDPAAAVPAVSPPVEVIAQATDAAAQPPEQPAAPGRKEVDPAVVEQIVKRLTDLEVEVALLKGRREEAPAPAAPPAKEAEKADEKPADKKEEKEPVKQTEPAAPVAALKQTVPQPAAATAASTPTPSSPGKQVDTELQALVQDMDNGDPSALKRLFRNLGGHKA